MDIKKRKFILSILVIYTFLILYFMFFSFERTHILNSNEYNYNLIPSFISLKFPTSLEYFHLWLFNLGNFVAFIPFGILLPLLYRYTFIRFISLFFISIMFLELLQMLSFLGSLDIDDAIVNTLGAAVGFGSYKIGFRTHNYFKNFVITSIVGLLLSIGVIGVSHFVNLSLIKKAGDVVPLNQLKESSGNAIIGESFPSIDFGNEEIKPSLNLYERENNKVVEFTYLFDDYDDIILSGHIGIPNDATGTEGMITISNNEEIIETHSVRKDGMLNSFEIALNNLNELSITIEGEALLWDVTITEMNNWWE